MPRGSTARLFAALAPPQELCEELAVWGRAAASAMGAGARASTGASVRLLAPEAMHVTLCFLGARPTGEIETLARALEECDAAALRSGAADRAVVAALEQRQRSQGRRSCRRRPGARSGRPR